MLSASQRGLPTVYRQISALLLLLVSLLSGTTAIAVEGFHHEADGISYYLERRGAGPHFVMVTSGQGDSGAYRFLADLLAERYTVITFDPPGFSRSSDPPSWEMSSALLGDQVAALVKSLGIERATFFGSSSGGTTILSLVADHPRLVEHAIIHEPAVSADIPFFNFLFPRLIGLKAYFGGGFAEEERADLYGEGESLMIADRALYRTLGEDHLERRIRNKEIWFDRYAWPDIPCCNREFTTEELQRAPLTVTLGERSSDWFGSGVKKLAERAGTQAVIVPGKHFAYVTNPERMAEVVYTAAERAAR